MVTVKTGKLSQTKRMEQAAERLDFLAGNARTLRSPALWDQYHEAVRIAGLLGFTVTQTAGKHKVRPC
nr:MAG TPA: hypothetical protein [Caudoviricetes sp.]